MQRVLAHQAPHGVSQARIPKWVAIPFPFPGDLPNSGIETVSPALEADSLLLSKQSLILLYSIQTIPIL